MMNTQILVYTFAIAGLSFIAAVLHELGHWLYFKLALKKNVEMSFSHTGEDKDYLDLSAIEKIRVYFSGIFTGLMFIVIISSVDVVLSLALVPYIGGCRSDIKKIIGQMRNGKN